MRRENQAFDLHVLVCTNTRPEGAKSSCGRFGADEIRAELKDWLPKELERLMAGFKGPADTNDRLQAPPPIEPSPAVRVRVNSSGCLDRCAQGVTIAIYPSGELFYEIKSGDLDLIKTELHSKLEELLRKKSQTPETLNQT